MPLVQACSVKRIIWNITQGCVEAAGTFLTEVSLQAACMPLLQTACLLSNHAVSTGTSGTSHSDVWGQHTTCRAIMRLAPVGAAFMLRMTVSTGHECSLALQWHACQQLSLSSFASACQRSQA